MGDGSPGVGVLFAFASNGGIDVADRDFAQGRCCCQRRSRNCPRCQQRVRTVCRDRPLSRLRYSANSSTRCAYGRGGTSGSCRRPRKSSHCLASEMKAHPAVPAIGHVVSMRLATNPPDGSRADLLKIDFIDSFQTEQVDEHEQVLCNEAERTSGSTLRSTMGKVAQPLFYERSCRVAIDCTRRLEELIKHSRTSRAAEGIVRPSKDKTDAAAFAGPAQSPV